MIPGNMQASQHHLHSNKWEMLPQTRQKGKTDTSGCPLPSTGLGTHNCRNKHIHTHKVVDSVFLDWQPHFKTFAFYKDWGSYCSWASIGSVFCWSPSHVVHNHSEYSKLWDRRKLIAFKRGILLATISVSDFNALIGLHWIF